MDRDIQRNGETRGARERKEETLLTRERVRDLFGEETWRHRVPRLRFTVAWSCGETALLGAVGGAETTGRSPGCLRARSSCAGLRSHQLLPAGAPVRLISIPSWAGLPPGTHSWGQVLPVSSSALVPGYRQGARGAGSSDPAGTRVPLVSGFSLSHSLVFFFSPVLSFSLSHVLLFSLLLNLSHSLSLPLSPYYASPANLPGFKSRQHRGLPSEPWDDCIPLSLHVPTCKIGELLFLTPQISIQKENAGKVPWHSARCPGSGSTMRPLLSKEQCIHDMLGALLSALKMQEGTSKFQCSWSSHPSRGNRQTEKLKRNIW